MSPVAAPSDKRFRRAHVKPARRRRTVAAIAKPLATYSIVAVLFAYGVYRVSLVAAHAGVLQIEKINVHGNVRLSKGEVLAVLNGLQGQSLVWTDLDAWQKRLLASPWVRDASLRRSLPSTVDVAIAERRPVGIGRITGDMYLIDERGFVIDQYGPQYADLDLPIVDGLSMRSAGTGIPGAEMAEDGGLATDEARGDLAARLIASLSAKPAIAKRLSQIDVSDLHNATVILNGDTAVIQLGDDQFLQRLESYLDLASALRERVAEIDYVDLRFDDRIYVRPPARERRTAQTARKK